MSILLCPVALVKLTVIIVSYNVKYYLEQCLDSLHKALGDIDSEVYVVDNHSHDGTVEYLSPKFKEIHFISSSHNLGFARANNLAIRQCHGDYILLLNPDTIVGEHTIKECLLFIEEHVKVGGIGVRMLKDDGSNAMESRRGLPTPIVAFYKMIGLCKRFPLSHRFAHYYMSYLSWDKPEKIEVISGAFFMIRHKLLDEIGLLDEDFFMYGEDIDLSYRLHKAGWESWYLPSKILHYKGESTQKSSFRYVHVFYEAMLIFFRKHYGSMRILYSIPIKLAIYIKAMSALISMSCGKLHKNLGFPSNNKKMDPVYYYIGEAVRQFSLLAQSKGLTFKVFEGSEETLPNGHLEPVLRDAVFSEDSPAYVVYDVKKYSYEKILDIFSRSNRDTVHLGTYNPDTNILITSEEVMS